MKTLSQCSRPNLPIYWNLQKKCYMPYSTLKSISELFLIYYYEQCYCNSSCSHFLKYEMVQNSCKNINNILLCEALQQWVGTERAIKWWYLYIASLQLPIYVLLSFYFQLQLRWPTTTMIVKATFKHGFT